MVLTTPKTFFECMRISEKGICTSATARFDKEKICKAALSCAKQRQMPKLMLKLTLMADRQARSQFQHWPQDKCAHGPCAP
mmetsp:Transcript_22441/g.46545  ORF Transcript_22441/g.46545 Transcript_22441/m.46545 type:complete len:81 (-) Transcript_22441:1158-1400(-)